jgi:hypothetical protein
LREGSYVGDLTVRNGGSEAAPVTIRSYPGESATILGRVQIEDSANFVTLAFLNLDGKKLEQVPSITVSGNDVRFIGNDVTNQNSTICFDLGPTTYGRAHRTVIELNLIHDCGSLPPTNMDHAIYVEHATGAQIVDNVIRGNSDRGVQLYPDAQSTYIARNVIDGNGEGVLIGGGDEGFGPQASSGNVVEHNLITFSRERYNVEAHWGTQLVGEGNVVRRNCVFGGARDGDHHGLAPESGFVAYENVLEDPLYVNRAAGDIRLAPASPCFDLPEDRPIASGLAPLGTGTLLASSARAGGIPAESALRGASGRVRPLLGRKRPSLRLRAGRGVSAPAHVRTSRHELGRGHSCVSCAESTPR